MRYKVPQNIDMQDRVIGPLTMAQFVYVIIGGGLTYTIFTSLPSPIGPFLAVPIGVLTFCIGFVKVNERPFWIFLASIFGFMSSPRQRVWYHDPAVTMKVEIYTPEKVQSSQNIPTKNISHEEIVKMARQSDKSGPQ